MLRSALTALRRCGTYAMFSRQLATPGAATPRNTVPNGCPRFRSSGPSVRAEPRRYGVFRASRGRESRNGHSSLSRVRTTSCKSGWSSRVSSQTPSGTTIGPEASQHAPAFGEALDICSRPSDIPQQDARVTKHRRVRETCRWPCADMDWRPRGFQADRQDGRVRPEVLRQDRNTDGTALVSRPYCCDG